MRSAFIRLTTPVKATIRSRSGTTEFRPIPTAISTRDRFLRARRLSGRAIYVGKWLQSAPDPTCETVFSSSTPAFEPPSVPEPARPLLPCLVRFTRMQKSAKHPEETSDSWSDAVNVSLFVVENYSLPQLCTVGTVYTIPSIISARPRIEIVFRGVKNTDADRSLIKRVRTRRAIRPNI